MLYKKPKTQKYEKYQKGKSFNKINSSLFSLNNLKFGVIGLKSCEFGRISSPQLFSIYSTLNKKLKKVAKICIHKFPQTPITKKPIEVRMGKGKGNVYEWISKIKTGMLICSIETKSISVTLHALKLAQLRLPIKTKIFFAN